MNETKTLALFAGAAGLVWLATRGVAVPGAALPENEVRRIVNVIVDQHFPKLDREMVVRIAYIESSFNPTAVRYEAGISDFSAGLMQTLTRTAQWLAGGRYGAFPSPSMQDLFKPEVSIYFGAAFLDWLSTRASNTRGQGEEVIVRAYNGGAAGWARDATLAYWAKYQRAREVIG